jgi:hypothetical protein
MQKQSQIFSCLQVPVKAEQESPAKASLPFWLFGSGEPSVRILGVRLDLVRRNRMRSDSVPEGDANRFLIRLNVCGRSAKTVKWSEGALCRSLYKRLECLGSVVARVGQVLAGLFACARRCLILERMGRLVLPTPVITAFFTII